MAHQEQKNLHRDPPRGYRAYPRSREKRAKSETDQDGHPQPLPTGDQTRTKPHVVDQMTKGHETMTGSEIGLSDDPDHLNDECPQHTGEDPHQDLPSVTRVRSADLPHLFETLLQGTCRDQGVAEDEAGMYSLNKNVYVLSGRKSQALQL